MSSVVNVLFCALLYDYNTYGIDFSQNEQLPGGDIVPSDELVMEIFKSKFQLLGDRVRAICGNLS